MTAGRPGLSCYTANLAGYLDAEWDGAAILARSVRLAVRIDPPLAFTHHGEPLDVLPDGTRLRYSTAPGTDALAGLSEELHRYGRAIAVVDGTRLPWSPARGGGAPAPHWLLVESLRGNRWHVVDDFTGLLPAGQQDPYHGWLDGRELRAAMALPRWQPVQRCRNALAFGFPVPVPEPPPGGALWLRRTAGDDRAVAPLPGRWLDGDDQVLPYLAAYLTGLGERAEPYLDDCWAAAGHRAFAYHWRLSRTPVGAAERERLTGAAQRWSGLPRALRYAVESARRGHPRPALVLRAIDELLDIERDTIHHAGSIR